MRRQVIPVVAICLVASVLIGIVAGRQSGDDRAIVTDATRSALPASSSPAVGSTPDVTPVHPLATPVSTAAGGTPGATPVAAIPDPVSVATPAAATPTAATPTAATPTAATPAATPIAGTGQAASGTVASPRPTSLRLDGSDPASLSPAPSASPTLEGQSGDGIGL